MALQKRVIRFGNVHFDKAARERINEILATNENTEGRYVAEFESKFAAKFGFKHAVMTSSGTTAAEVLWMAVAAWRAVRWGSGTVLTPALAFGSTANSISRAGLAPFFVDISSDLNMALPGSSYAGLCPIGMQFVLNMGRSTRVNSMQAYAQAHGLFFAVDACEGHGATFDAMSISEFCDAAIYSFYPAHIMTVGGEGGMIATNNKTIADLCRSIKSHGRPFGSIEHKFRRIGTNAKTTEMAAAVGLSALNNFDRVFRNRRAIRKGLLERFAEFPITIYPDGPRETIAPHAFPIVVTSSWLESLKLHLDEWGIEHKPLWGALSNHDAHQWLNIPWGTYPVAELIGAGGLHFGCHEDLTESDLDYIRDVFRLFFRR